MIYSPERSNKQPLPALNCSQLARSSDPLQLPRTIMRQRMPLLFHFGDLELVSCQEQAVN